MQTNDEIKSKVVAALVRRYSAEELVVWIADCEMYAKRATDTEIKNEWLRQAEDCQKLLRDQSYLNGEYPQSLDRLVMELVEWRALTNALLHAFEEEPWLNSSAFFCMWINGAAYSSIAALGKLASYSTTEKDSITKLWHEADRFLVEDGILSERECLEINCGLKVFNSKNKSDATVMRNRNKAFMHNEVMSNLTWEQFDDEFRLVARVMYLLMQWAGLSSVQFRNIERLTSDIERFLQPVTVRQCQQIVSEYVHSFQQWCTTGVIDGVSDKRTSFGSISVEPSSV